MESAQKGFITTTIVFITIGLIFIGIGIYYLFFNSQSNPPSSIKKTEINQNKKSNPDQLKSTEQIKQTLGEPIAKAQSDDKKKEIWVYKIAGEDSTALYFYIDQGLVSSTKKDEFNGEISDVSFLSQASTTDWKEYSGEIYTIKLPPNWSKSTKLSFKDSTTEREAFTPFSNAQITQQLEKDPYDPSYYLEIEIRDNPDKVTLQQWTNDTKYTAQSSYMKRSQVQINENTAIKITGTSSQPDVDYYLSHKGKVINISYYYSKTDPMWISDDQFSQEIFESIVHSMKLKK